MASGGPDLFVICKSCGSEVSPYITECPYCGTRLRKRAPKLERGGTPKPPRARRTRPSLGRLRPGEIPGIRAEVRPFVAWLLVVAPVLLTLVTRTGLLDTTDVALVPGLGLDEPWRIVTTLFVYTQTGYEIVAVAASGLFAWLLERRHGWWAPLFVFLATGAGGMGLVLALDPEGVAVGANGAALGLLACWAVRDLLGRRAGREDESDMLGVLAIAAVLILLPLASQEAHALAGLGGGAIGLVLGLLFSRLRER